jgi:hypothetical protein
MKRVVLRALCLSLAFGGCREARPPPQTSGGSPHVLLLHLDGFRADLTRTLLEQGRLRNLDFLGSRGRISYEATTVDKSETMKVIPSYLTSQLDSSLLGVVGWWQFDRSDFRFRNFWLDPAEVVSYALGLGFPRSPTVQDFLSARGENLVSGMSLARRGVPFLNYGRAYVEGVEAVGSHTYLRQAHATMSAFLDIHRRIAEGSEPSPALSSLLLAAADEFSHAEGVSAPEGKSEHCFEREQEADETAFRLLDEDVNLDRRYFTRVERSRLANRAERICIELPLLEEGRPAHPSYVLSMLVLDIELGRLLDTFRGIRSADGASLFDRTLFLVFGDHGMVDTPNGFPKNEPFVEYLNRRLSLSSQEGELGIDDSHLPHRLKYPELATEWQPEEVRRITTEADRWAREFLDEIRELLRDNLHESYWWLFFLRALLIDPKLDQALAPVSEEATAVLRQLYLRGVPAYGKAELEANRELFDRQVRLVYGGGALNNAELFLPVCEGSGSCTWGRRPSYPEILAYRGGALFDALREHEAVGLIFVRKNNELFSDSSPLPERCVIEVLDRAGNRGAITVRRDPNTDELSFHYLTEPGSRRDPLGYEEWGRDGGSSGSYNEWNDRTLSEDYVNVVGGVGAYLYSTHPAIGDVLLMHASDWNFGDNLGGHGGVHRLEKTTFLLASGPGIESGELWSVAAGGGSQHSPTLLDLTPTALEWLGHSREEFEAFGREEFPRYLDSWIRSQRGEILSHLDRTDSLERARADAEMEELSLEPLLPRIERLLLFIEAEREAWIEGSRAPKLLGNSLELPRDR